MDPIILALDLATVSGWAGGRATSTPPPLPLEASIEFHVEHCLGYGTFTIGPPGCDVGEALLNYERWLLEKMWSLNPEPDQQISGVIYEAPYVDVRKMNIYVVRKLMGLIGITDKCCRQRKIPWVREAAPSTIKLHWTGSGNASKERMMQVARERGFDPQDDNAADAIALRDFAQCIIARSTG